MNPFEGRVQERSRKRGVGSGIRPSWRIRAHITNAPGWPPRGAQKVDDMSPTPFDNRIPNDHDERDHHDDGGSGTATRDYRPLADQAEARLEVGIAEACDVELMAVSHVTAGTGIQNQPAYEAILESLRDRHRAAARDRSVSENRRQKKPAGPSRKTSNAYTRGHCRSPMRVTDKHHPTGLRVDKLVPCRNCEPCQIHAAEVRSRWATANIGAAGFAYTVTEDEWRSRSRDGLAAKLKAAGARSVTIPLQGGRRAVIATVAVGPCTPADTATLARDASLNEAGDGRRVSASCVDPARHPPMRILENGRKVPQPCQGACKPRSLAAVDQELMGDTDTDSEDWIREGYHHANTIEHMEAAAATAGLEDTYRDGHGLAIPAGQDPRRLHAYNLRIGFVPFAKASRGHRGSPELPVAEAWLLWQRWQEGNEPPPEVYDDDQLALQVAS